MNAEHLIRGLIEIGPEGREEIWRELERRNIQVGLLTPHEAYHKALTTEGSDDLRRRSCLEPRYAFKYAVDIDWSPHPDTRRGACGDPKYAYLYAYNVDHGFHEDTWEAVQGTEHQRAYENWFLAGRRR